MTSSGDEAMEDVSTMSSSGESGDEVPASPCPTEDVNIHRLSDGTAADDAYGLVLHEGTTVDVGEHGGANVTFPKTAADYALVETKDGDGCISAIRSGPSTYYVLDTAKLQALRVKALFGRMPTNACSTAYATASLAVADGSSSAAGVAPSLPATFRLRAGLVHGYDAAFAHKAIAKAKEAAKKKAGQDGPKFVRLSNGKHFKSGTLSVVELGAEAAVAPQAGSLPDTAAAYTIAEDAGGDRKTGVLHAGSVYVLDTAELSKSRVAAILAKTGMSPAKITKLLADKNTAMVCQRVVEGDAAPDPLSVVPPAIAEAFTQGKTLHLFDTFLVKKILAAKPKADKKAERHKAKGDAAKPAAPLAATSAPRAKKAASLKRECSDVDHVVPTPDRPTANSSPPPLKRSRTARQVVSNNPAINDLFCRPLGLVVEGDGDVVTSANNNLKGFVEQMQLRCTARAE